MKDLVIPVTPDPPGTPPQRGFIDRQHAHLLKTAISVAKLIGEKMFGIEDCLDKDIEYTEDRAKKVDATVKAMLAGGQIKLGRVAPDEFRDMVMAELFGLGPLERFTRSDQISEIMVNGPYVIFVEQNGKLTETGHKFLDDEHVLRVIQRIVRPLGREVGPQSPLVDGRLPDGSRVNAAVAPCTLDGPSITIRKFAKHHISLDQLIAWGAMTPGMGEFLKAIVSTRHNIIVSGGTGSGKTTLINALSEFIDPGERVVTIEDAAELKLTQRNVVRMESKKPSIEDRSEVTIRDCLVNALRMRPERILIGECRSSEALDMLQAMNTGHDGSMTTVHANTPRDALSRIETLSMMGGVNLPLNVLRKQMASAVHFIVQAARLRDGSRKVTHITEVQGMEGQTITLGDIFVFDEEGVRGGKIIGKHRACGIRPNAMEVIEMSGIRLPQRIFF
ncbi:MAG: CpaF family protein [Myxococcales bacterium]|nr:CpaF family protein [Myxococcales bacterium]MCB9693178.1 CpaF family protein [Alphaproteobacteria bacterium]